MQTHMKGVSIMEEYECECGEEVKSEGDLCPTCEWLIAQ